MKLYVSNKNMYVKNCEGNYRLLKKCSLLFIIFMTNSLLDQDLKVEISTTPTGTKMMTQVCPGSANNFPKIKI